MVDVLHVFFEEDLIPLWEEHQAAQSQVRETIYTHLYDRPYKYRLDKTASSSTGDPMVSVDVPEDRRELKPYLPPTNPEDLPGILDGPLG